MTNAGWIGRIKIEEVLTMDKDEIEQSLNRVESVLVILGCKLVPLKSCTGKLKL